MKRITLLNINKFSPLEVFEFVAAHLLKQNKRAIDKQTNTCQYRTKSGKKCAFGCLIPKKLYKPDMENRSCPNLIENFFPNAKAYQKLLIKLQLIHDTVPPAQWQKKLEAFRQNKKNKL
jgi:hypothetical protein